MYYQSYEEYMRDVLGYPNGYDRNTPTYYYDNYNYEDENTSRSNDELYPDIYRKVYPEVCRVCDKNTRSISKETIEEMTEEVYSNLENAGKIEMGASVKVEVRNNSNVPKTREEKEREKQNQTRQIQNSRNPLLQDLIRILLLRELFNRPSRPRPPRPPYPGPRPPYPGQRPPMPRNNYSDYMDQRYY